MTDTLRSRLEEDEDARLAPWALRSRGATRRRPVEDDRRAFDYRTRFQRDRDRVVYSRAFRRLRHKAQAGILPAYEDHRRNRLTHTLEVAQFARTIGRSLGLNEDLIEAVALAHDLGSTPFGPAGERALHDLASGRMDGHGGAGLGDVGGFHRVEQGLRVVDVLEKRYAHPGLNLTDRVREGILKCGPGGDAGSEPVGVADGGAAAAGEPEEDGLRRGLPAPFEIQAVRLGDRICSALSDLDDALQAGVVDVSRVERIGAVRELKKKLGAAYPTRAGRFMKANAIHRGLMHLLVTGAVLHGRKTLEAWAERHGVADHARFLEVREEAVRGDEVAPPPAGLRLLEDLERFLDRAVRRNARADRLDARGRRVVLGLFAAYFHDPTLLDDHVLLRVKEAAGVRFLRDVPRDRLGAELARRWWNEPRFVRALCDHLAAMTDPFALEEHARLHAMGAIPIPGAEQLRRERSAARTPDPD